MIGEYDDLDKYCQYCGALCKEFFDGSIKRTICIKCGKINYKNPYPCVSVLTVKDQNKILLGRRGKDSIIPFKWWLPCGYVEYNETFVEAAKREVEEETGILIKPIGIINVVSNHFDNGTNSIVTVLLAAPKTETLTPGDDITECGWFDINSELPELAFAADHYIINEYKSSLKSKGKLNYIELSGSSFKN